MNPILGNEAFKLTAAIQAISAENNNKWIDTAEAVAALNQGR
jgi:hypothetical protein